MPSKRLLSKVKERIERMTSNSTQQPTQLVRPSLDTFYRTDKYGILSMHPQNPPFNDAGSEENYLLDIVAVHGITGDAYDTWTHENGKIWLRDFLPDDFPGARVFSFGYDARVFCSLGEGTVESYARSLLEGLTRERTEEKALITARLDAEDYGDITNSVSAILFLATPHRGSETTQLPKVLAEIANLALTGTSLFIGRNRTDLIGFLERDSEGLKRISTDFRNQMGDMKIASFIETSITPPSRTRIVDDNSGVVGIPKERIVHMDGCDHRNICRFSDKTSNGYQTVLGVLKPWAKDARRVTSDKPTPEDLRNISHPMLAS
ncbi:hypothetical protein GP486_003124 [Trichoglossum hirsutum]|uniref:DUF676 domain-containing protein n=1 Tax=Trichoglossum hirsutum TaxID=265104 RepID=A0A9P8RRG1_9PEZI|nr:hypothetical protein GP486_003124 [Trichoglossum hirsutum]